MTPHNTTPLGRALRPDSLSFRGFLEQLSPMNVTKTGPVLPHE
ncbi:unnamed protein product, partial [Allacma fusca]